MTTLQEIRRSLAELKYDLACITAEFKFRQQMLALKAGFNPLQLRNQLGRWALESTDKISSDISEFVTQAQKLNIAAGPNAMSRCIDLCYPILERPRLGDRNEWDFRKCLNVCLGLGR